MKNDLYPTPQSIADVLDIICEMLLVAENAVDHHSFCVAPWWGNSIEQIREFTTKLRAVESDPTTQGPASAEFGVAIRS